MPTDAPRLVHGLVSLAETVASSGPLDERLAALCRIAVELIGCDRSSLFVLDGEHYRGIANHGNPPDVAARFPRHRVSARDPLVCAALEAGHPVIVNDAPESALMHAETARVARIRAIVVAPMEDGGGGVPGFQTAEYNENPGRFDATESALLSGVARLAGLAIGRDRAEREHRELAEKLRRQDRLDALGRLAAGVAHDFNNLLSVIIGYADLLRDGLAKAPSMKRELDHLRSAADRATSLTAKLLAFAGADLVEPKSVDLGRLVQELTPLLERTVRADVALNVSAVEGLPRVRVDPRAIENAVVNLVANARDALPRGGRIDVAVEADADGGVAIRVEDDGEGMDEATRERAFEPFFTTKGLGTGLGLAAVHGAVQQAGGQLRFDSELGRGTRAELAFPALEDTSVYEYEPAASASSSAGCASILLVEDEPLLREVMERSLARAGHRVLAFSDGESALRHVVGAGIDIDLLVTDVVLPGMDGAEVAQRLRILAPTLPVLLTSGYAEESARRAASALAPPPRLLPKPFTPGQLVALAGEALLARA